MIYLVFLGFMVMGYLASLGFQFVLLKLGMSSHPAETVSYWLGYLCAFGIPAGATALQIVRGNRMDEKDHAAETIKFNADARRTITDVIEKILVIWDNTNSQDLAAIPAANRKLLQRLKKRINSCTIAMADPFAPIICAGQDAAINFLSAAENNEESINGLTWQEGLEALRYLRERLGNAKNCDPIDNDNVLRMVEAKRTSESLSG